MILGINTAQRMHEMALVREVPDGSRELVAEKIWADERRDVEDLVPFLQDLLEGCGLTKKDIDTIVVVAGPGSFTALRTGVAFANALREGLGTKLYALSTFELLIKKVAAADTVLAILHAGGLDVGVKKNTDPVKVGSLATLLNDFPHDHGIKVVCELTETEREELNPLVKEKGWQIVEGHELLTMGEVLATSGISGMAQTDIASPIYLRTPHITKSSDPWKQ